MTFLRILSAAMLLAIVGYTAKTISLHGWNLIPVFFGDMKTFAWPGQFNFDFMLMLTLSGMWTLWRYKFSLKGLILGLLALVGGILFQSAHLLYLSFKEPDIKSVLIGER